MNLFLQSILILNNIFILKRKKEILKSMNLNCVIKHGKYTLMQMLPIITTQFTLPFKIEATSTITNNVIVFFKIGTCN